MLYTVTKDRCWTVLFAVVGRIMIVEWHHVGW